VILLVEDDGLVRELLRDFLESAGYAVVEASSGEEALRAAEGGTLALDLVVTDIDLPGLDGATLAARLRNRRPDIAVLYVSGNPVDLAAGGAVGGRVGSLSKPFTRELLLGKVRALLGTP